MSDAWAKGIETITLVGILLLSLSVLMQPKFLPGAHQLAVGDVEREEWALAYNTAKAKYDNIPEAELRRIADDRIAQLRENGQLEGEIRRRTAVYRDGMRDSEGVTYPTHVDSYLYLRYTRDVAQRGTYGGDTPRAYDSLRSAPAAEFIERNPLPYLFAGAYRTVHRIVPSLSLVEVVVWYPVLFGTLLVAAFYLLLRSIAGIRAAQFSALFLAIHPHFFAAFQWGYTDTNAFNITCGAALLMLIYITLTAEKGIWKMGALLAAVPLFMLFSNVWAGAAVFGTLAVGILGIGIAVYLWHYPSLRKHRRTVLLLTVVSGVGSGLWLYGTLLKDRIAHYLTGESTGSLPNPFPYVGEFKALHATEVIGQVGGPISPLAVAIASVGIVGLLLLMARAWGDPKRRVGAVLLLAWFLALAYPATRLRFLQFAILPIAALVGIGSAEVVAWCSSALARRELPVMITRAGPSMLLGVLIVLALAPATTGAVRNANPMMNDAIGSIAEAVRKDSPQDAIIATWWNDGYLYQYFAERGTYFDGASFDSQTSYWMSRYFMETDRQVARNIIRALSCEVNALPSLVRSFPNDTMLRVNSLLQMDKEQAEEVLREQLGDYAFQAVDPNPDHFILGPGQVLISDLYCTNPYQTYVVVSEEFLDLIWAFDWYRKVDFERPERPISGRSELNGVTISCNTISSRIICEQGVTVELQTGVAHDARGNRLPFFFNDGTQLYRPQEDVPPNRPVLILYVDGDRLRGALINSDILNSMLVKLLFFDGAGMPEYEKIAEASGRYQPRVVAYRVSFSAEI